MNNDLLELYKQPYNDNEDMEELGNNGDDILTYDLEQDQEAYPDDDEDRYKDDDTSDEYRERMEYEQEKAEQAQEITE